MLEYRGRNSWRFIGLLSLRAETDCIVTLSQLGQARQIVELGFRGSGVSVLGTLLDL